MTLTAAPASGSMFAGWSGDCGGSSQTTSVTLAGARSCTATFDVEQQETATLNVTVTGAGSGTVTSSPSGISCPSGCSASYDTGTEVTLTAAAASGSMFAGWSGACGGNSQTASVTLAGARSCTATFDVEQQETATLNVTVTGAGSGTVTSSPSGISCPSGCSASYDTGTEVTLTAAAASGSMFAGWSGACGGNSQTASVTLAGARSCTATFDVEQQETATLNVTVTGAGSGTVTSSPSGISCPSGCSTSYDTGTEVTLTAAPASGSTFASWSGACGGNSQTTSVTMDAARSCTATFDVEQQETATLNVTVTGAGSGTVTSSPSGISCPSGCSASYDTGTEVTLTAAPASGSTFASWSGACGGSSQTASVTLAAGRSCTATFDVEQFTLSLTIAGSGSGSVTSSPSGINCASGCSASYDTGTEVTLTAAPASGSTFASWSGACGGNSQTTSVTMDAARSCTATFDVEQQETATLNVTVTGAGSGTVTSSPSGISCPSGCSASYDTGTEVTLTAAPASGSTFASWSGACGGSSQTASVTLAAGRSCTATFDVEQQETATLNVTVTGAGSGTVTSSPSGISCPSGCSASYDTGTEVTLIAAFASGSTFAGWSGDCSAESLGVTVTMDAARSCTATFDVAEYDLVVDFAGTGSGTVTLADGPNTTDCTSTCGESYAAGTEVTLTAVPASGSTFAEWGNGCGREFNGQTVTITMDTIVRCTATFDAEQFTLSLTFAGSGSGSVTSSPSGINCGSGNEEACSASYDTGTEVTLTAAPASGSTFAGWSGDCGGSSQTASVTMDAARSCTATFDVEQFTLSLTIAGSGSGTVTLYQTTNCTSTCSESYDTGTEVTLTATPASGSTFAAWSGDDCGGSSQTTSVTMDAARSCTATFDVEQFTLSLTITGSGSGTVTLVDGNDTTSCSSNCSESYDTGTEVTLTATPDNGSTFAGFSGDCGGTMTAAQSCTATFNVSQSTLSLTMTGSGSGTVTLVDGNDTTTCTSNCSKSYDIGTSVTLIPDPNGVSFFIDWGGDCANGTGRDLTWTVTMNSNVSCSVVFDLQ